MSGKKVNEYTIRKASQTFLKIYNIATGTYNARIYSLGIYSNSSEYASVKFSCTQEAQIVSVFQPNRILEIGETYTYQIATYPTDGVTMILEFYAGEKTDKSIVNIEKDGSITGLKEGDTIVYFHYKTSQTEHREGFNIKVVKPVQLDIHEKKLEIGEKFKINITSKPINSTPKFSSSNTKVATVDEYGNITAISAGTARISANAMIENTDRNKTTRTLSDKCEITVLPADVEVTNVRINYAEINTKIRKNTSINCCSIAN